VSVGFIKKKSVTMHGHMNLNKERKSTLIMFFISDPYNGTINNQPTQ